MDGDPGEGLTPRQFYLETFQLSPESVRPLSIGEIKRLSQIVDSDGIPLESDRAPEELIEGIDFLYEAFPYKNSSSRCPHGQAHETPMSGLEHQRLLENYADILRVFTDIRGEVMKLLTHEGRPLEGQSLNLIGGIKVLQALKFLPIYLTFRSENPVALQGELPPAIINISNSASGTLGAIWGYIQTNMGNAEVLQAHPDADAIVEDAERKGNMVGEKTVCVAKPAMMKNFIKAVFDGAPVPARASLNIWEYMDPSEVTNLLHFAHSFTFCDEAISPLCSTDFKTAVKMAEHLKLGHSDRRIRETLKPYFLELHTVLSGITMHQIRLNEALGREAGSPALSEATYEEELRLLMPAILRRLRPEQLPEPYASGTQHFHVDLIDPAENVWGVLAALVKKHPELLDQ